MGAFRSDVPADAGTVFEALARSAARYPAHDLLQVVEVTAAAYGIEARCHSYREIFEQASGWAEAYRASGVGHGHRVGLLLGNRPEFFVHWFALNALGVSVVPLNADWRSGELEYVLGHSELCHALVLDNKVDAVNAAARAIGRRISVAASSQAAVGRPSVTAPHVGSAIAAGAPGTGAECALLYTSGTTGRPKGCMLANEYFLVAGRWYAGSGELSTIIDGTDRLITPLPLVHMNAMAFSTMVMLLTGGCVVQLDRFHPGSWWESVRESRATITHYLGVMPAMLLDRPPDPRDRTHSLRFGLGSGVAKAQHGEFESRFGFRLLEGWAMTEGGAGATVLGNREPRHAGTACFGRPGAFIEWRIVDDDGADVPVGTPGELLVRRAGANPGLGFFSGYLKDPDATAAIWQGRYLNTGDLVRADDEGYLYFVDRKKNIIRRSGENISAVEVESALLAHPAVKAVGVSAVDDPVRGDEVMACVIPNEPIISTQGAQALAEALVRHCLERLAYYKAPGYIAFCDELPLTPTQKIQRSQLKAYALARKAAGECIDLCGLKVRQI